MTNYLTAAWAAFVRLIRPDVDAIIAAFVKAQTKLEGYIERELQQTQRETQAIAQSYDYIETLVTSRSARNEAINRAYRVIHKLDELVS